MYKLFVTRITKRIFSDSISYLPKQIIVHRSMRLCSFCNFYHWKTSKFMTHHQIRTNTTTVNILDQPPVKKKRKRSKKYIEILEVMNEKTKNKRAIIQRLNSANISEFVNQSDVTDAATVIGDPCSHKISHPDHAVCPTDMNLNIGDKTDKLFNTEVEQCNESSNNQGTAKNLKECSDADDVPCHDKTLREGIPVKEQKLTRAKENKTSQKQKPSDTRRNYVTQDYIQKLLANMQVCINCGMLNRAKRILVVYKRSVQHKVKDSCNHIKLYNLLLEAYASKGNFLQVLQLYMIIKESLTPTPQTYVYVLDALAKVEKYKHRMAYLKKFHSEMEERNISFNDVFNKSHFKNDQQENVLRMVKLLMPEFEPSYTPVDTKNKCELLNKVPMENNYESPAQGLLTINELKDLLHKQIRSEVTIEMEIENIAKLGHGNVEIKQSKIIELEHQWREMASVAFERNLGSLKGKESSVLLGLHPFLEVLDRKSYIDAIIREIKGLARGSETYSLSLKMLYWQLGKRIYRKYEVQTKEQSGELDKITSIYEKYLEWYLNPEDKTKFSKLNNRTVWQYIEREQKRHGASLNTLCLKWPHDVIINIGQFLYNIILNDIILQPDNSKGHDSKCSIPAFYKIFRNDQHYVTEQIKPHPTVSKLFKESSSQIIAFDSSFVPSCSPPRPWTSIDDGGYIILNTDFMRVPFYSTASMNKLQETPPQQLSPVFDSLNQLGAIPWMINSPILDIVIKIFRDGGSEKLNVPRSVSSLPSAPVVNKNATIQEKRKQAVEAAKHKQRQYETYSLWCETLYKLSLANHFRNKMFWLPHNMDFRGRVYPVPPHLNHLSSDLGRSLLLFAKAKPLGPKGFDWLKLHVINLTNLKKKASVEERLKYANENIENMLDSAAEPLTGKMWWTKSEEPWQTLAACMEIANALKAPDIEKYESRFPVHQDGSCNGLQHYAALGRDRIGAESVNLHPFDKPNDVYAAVADTIEKQRRIDAKNNVEIAKILDGHIQRKVIKQTVMTTVYGVTKFGAKLQILKQLQDIPEFPQEHAATASYYLMEKTFYSLRAMFQNAREIQDWFTQCARIIAKECGDSVQWVTPLGLPIVQPYIKEKKMTQYKYDKLMVPDVVKHKNAFAPNFVHSLDSTHMMLTCLHCREAGITFVSVHDCFWTHACTVDKMNIICREQFIALHSEPILENLSKFFVQRYMVLDGKPKVDDPEGIKRTKSNIFTLVPQKGTYDINNVLKSTHFFS